ncbi:MAG TPA: hypothetical protein VKP59_02275 [Candidatus Thermoplasmatota archaeon]|nr:hypothetical protein [Candidatus Thermoplasmatota archaeon]
MNLKSIGISIMLIILIVGFSGCVQENESDEQITQDVQLTDEDWNYFVFHYKSGKDLNQLFTSGFNIIDKEIKLFDPVNSSFLLEVNNSNLNELTNLKNISNKMYENISDYRSTLDDFMVSSNLIEHHQKQSNLFDVYENLSNLYLATYNRIISVYNSSTAKTKLVDISDIMQQLFVIEESINSIMDDQVQEIIDIPEEIWNKWEDKDWSFMNETQG